MKENLDQLLSQFRTLVEITARLRGPGGCPWDQEQTQESLAPFAIEEAHELAEAIASGDQDHVREELGDFLFQVLIQSQVASDEGHFSLTQVIGDLNEKMIARHPHVFGSPSESLKTSAEVLVAWDEAKAKAKAKAARKDWYRFSYPTSLPSLQVASKIGRATAHVHFDWTSINGVLEKVDEERTELQEAIVAGATGMDSAASVEGGASGRNPIEDEIGDLLFTLAQLARHLNLDPESCLRKANLRFQSRFSKVQEVLGYPTMDEFRNLSFEEKEEAWAQAKKQEV